MVWESPIERSVKLVCNTNAWIVVIQRSRLWGISSIVTVFVTRRRTITPNSLADRPLDGFEPIWSIGQAPEFHYAADSTEVVGLDYYG